MDIKIVKFMPHGDDRGQLIAIEENKDIPFDIKRVYYMYDTTTDAVRGKHAHKSLEQILICLNGSCKLLLDDGTEKQIVELNKANEGIYLSNLIWREIFDFSKEAVLMVLASNYYDESDYIRDYKKFIEVVKATKK